MTDLLALFAHKGEQDSPSSDLAFHDTQSQSWVRFVIGASHYALDIANVRELVDEPKVTRYPEQVDAHLGLVSVRGEVIPVRTLPGAPAASKATGEQSRLLVVDYDDHGVFGLLVNGAKEVVGDWTQAQSQVVTIDGDPVTLLQREDFA